MSNFESGADEPAASDRMYVKMCRNKLQSDKSKTALTNAALRGLGVMFVVLVCFVICPFRVLWFWSCQFPACQISAWSSTAKVLCTFPTGTATLPFLVRFLPEFGCNLTRTGAETITGGEGEERVLVDREGGRGGWLARHRTID